MQRLPEPRSWRGNTNAEHAEMRVRWLREQLIAADTAIAAQQRIIAADGPAEIYLLSIESLRSSQRKLEHELAELMSAREPSSSTLLCRAANTTGTVPVPRRWLSYWK